MTREAQEPLPLPDCLHYGEEGNLHFDHIPMSRLAEEHGTPVVLYSARSVRQNVARLMRSFDASGGGTRIFFSAKACYLRRVLHTVHALGMGIEVCSGNEFCLAQSAGVPTKDVLWNAVSLGREEEDLLARGPVGLLSLNTFDDLERASAVALAAGYVQRTLLRVHPRGIHGGYLDRGSKLGFDVEDGAAREAAQRALRLGGLRLAGLHAHTQIEETEPSSHLKALESICSFADELAGALGWHAEVIDVGGGIASGRDFARLGRNVEDFGRPLLGLLSQRRHRAQLVTEPGRFVVDDAAVALTRVLSRTKSAGQEWWITDVGSQYLVPFGGRQFPMIPVERRDNTREAHVSIGDRLSSYSGVLASGVSLPVSTGRTLLAAPYAGAYTQSVMQRFMYGMPEVVWCEDGRTQRLLERESPGRWSELVGGALPPG